MSDPIPAEDRPHRVSAATGLDPDPETTGIDPRNRAQGTGRFDDDEVAERRAAAADATADRAAAARGETAAATYDESDVPKNASDVVTWIQGADGDDDRAARVAVARQVEDAREGGQRTTVTDELNR